MKEESLIVDLEVLGNTIRVIPSPVLMREYLRDNFWVRYDESVDLRKLDESLLLVPFILNVAPVVWISGRIFHVPSLDAELAQALAEVRELFTRWYPNVGWTGEIVADELVKNHGMRWDDNRVALLYSGGLDSTTASLRRSDHRQLLITIRGSDVSLEDEAAWQRVQDLARAFATRFGHEVRFVESNFFASFLNYERLELQTKSEPAIASWWWSVQYGLGLIGLTVPLLATSGISQLLIASDSLVAMGWEKGEGSHPELESKIRCGNIRVRHVDAELTRQQKVRLIKEKCLELGVSPPILRVCLDYNSRGANCCKCEKCLRTIIGLMVEGERPEAYGFLVPKNVKRAFACYALDFSEHTVLFWKDIQLAARDYLSNRIEELQEDIQRRELLSWVAQFDFERYWRRYRRIGRLKKQLGKLLRHFPPFNKLVKTIVTQWLWKR